MENEAYGKAKNGPSYVNSYAQNSRLLRYLCQVPTLVGELGGKSGEEVHGPVQYKKCVHLRLDARLQARHLSPHPQQQLKQLHRSSSLPVDPVRELGLYNESAPDSAEGIVGG
jgi:hypothetical protein